MKNVGVFYEFSVVIFAMKIVVEIKQWQWYGWDEMMVVSIVLDLKYKTYKTYNACVSGSEEQWSNSNFFSGTSSEWCSRYAFFPAKMHWWYTLFPPFFSFTYFKFQYDTQMVYWQNLPFCYFSGGPGKKDIHIWHLSSWYSKLILHTKGKNE